MTFRHSATRYKGQRLDGHWRDTLSASIPCQLPNSIFYIVADFLLLLCHLVYTLLSFCSLSYVNNKTSSWATLTDKERDSLYSLWNVQVSLMKILNKLYFVVVVNQIFVKFVLLICVLLFILIIVFQCIIWIRIYNK